MDNELSKSQRKRNAALLTQMGKEFIDLPTSTLDKLPLSALLRQRNFRRVQLWFRTLLVQI